jgi:hypothetical protein
VVDNRFIGVDSRHSRATALFRLRAKQFHLHALSYLESSARVFDPARGKSTRHGP